MTENKINYQLNDSDLPQATINNFNMRDFLASNKYNWKNISLDPFQVIWLGAL
jgi:sucrose phosphorylase